MGARIAAHFANAGFPVDLLDVVLPNQPKRNAAALAGILLLIWLGQMTLWKRVIGTSASLNARANTGRISRSRRTIPNKPAA